jgi:hypothetical protein
MNISAVIVTKGDQDLSQIISALPFDDLVIWDNSKRLNYMVYGRYLAVAEAKYDVIYTQDDDCLVPNAKVMLPAYTDGEILCNVSPEHQHDYRKLPFTLVGWGAFFHRRLLTCFRRYWSHYPDDALFRRECDRVFTGLNRHRNLWVGREHLPWAHDGSRMSIHRNHNRDLQEIRRRIECLR